MNHLYIISAGVGSRMKSDTPKALLPVQGVPNVLRTVSLAKPHYPRITIVANVDVIEKWLEINHQLDENIDIIFIESGLGDGHATMCAIAKHEGESSNVTVVWGDAVFHDDEVFSIMSKMESGYGMVPVVKSENPYVDITLDEDTGVIKGALFSRFNEVTGPGLHDQCFFQFNRYMLLNVLRMITMTTYRNGVFSLPNNEMSLLYALHTMYNLGVPVEPLVFDKQVVTSYNTNEEFERMIKMLDELNEQ